jgi:hypothetical protein
MTDGSSKAKEEGFPSNSDAGGSRIENVENAMKDEKSDGVPLDQDRIEGLKAGGGYDFVDGVLSEQKDEDSSLPPLEQTHSHSSQLPLSKVRTIALVVTLTGAAFLNTLSVQASIIILPTIGRELKIPSAGQQWYLALGTAHKTKHVLSCLT